MRSVSAAFLSAQFERDGSHLAKMGTSQAGSGYNLQSRRLHRCGGPIICPATAPRRRDPLPAAAPLRRVSGSGEGRSRPSPIGRPVKLSSCRVSLILNVPAAASIIPPTVLKPFARKMAASCMLGTIFSVLKRHSRPHRSCPSPLPCGDTMPCSPKQRRSHSAKGLRRCSAAASIPTY